jgi:hypothetical protein
MAEHQQYYSTQNPGYGYGQGQYQNQQQYNQAHQVAKAVTAVTAGGSLLVLSGLTLVGTVIALTIATPLLVIFSPILVPAVITVALLTLGFMASGGFGVAAVSVLTWMYRYVTGKHPAGTEQFDNTRMKLGSKAQEMNERAGEIRERDRVGVHNT